MSSFTPFLKTSFNKLKCQLCILSLLLADDVAWWSFIIHFYSFSSFFFTSLHQSCLSIGPKQSTQHYMSLRGGFFYATELTKSEKCFFSRFLQILEYLRNEHFSWVSFENHFFCSDLGRSVKQRSETPLMLYPV